MINTIEKEALKYLINNMDIYLFPKSGDGKKVYKRIIPLGVSPESNKGIGYVEYVNGGKLQVHLNKGKSGKELFMHFDEYSLEDLKREINIRL